MMTAKPISTETIACRICYGLRYNNRDLIEPCHCKGTVAKVHRRCLEKWLNSNGSKQCELCLFEFDVRTKLRYRMYESISIWIKTNHSQRRLLIHDSIFFGAIIMISSLMIGIIIYVLQHIHQDATLLNQLPNLYFISLFVVASLWITIFITSIVMFFNLQIGPWLAWWRSTKKVSLLIN